MRITSKMMNDNSLYNINNNKAYQDKLNTQMATQKKFNDLMNNPDLYQIEDPHINRSRKYEEKH